MLRGAALVIPRGLLATRSGPAETPASAAWSQDAAARAEVERIAMAAVMAAERALGREPQDVSAAKRGWDIESRDLGGGPLRFIEVKGRRADGKTVVLTKNELLASLNSPDAFLLAIVQVEAGAAREPVYVRQFFRRELGFAETAVVFDVGELLSVGARPA